MDRIYVTEQDLPREWGRYQRDVSGAALKGKAKEYGMRYKRSRDNVIGWAEHKLGVYAGYAPVGRNPVEVIVTEDRQ